MNKQDLPRYDLPPSVQAFIALDRDLQCTLADWIAQGGFPQWSGQLSPKEIEEKRREESLRSLTADALLELADWLTGKKPGLGPDLAEEKKHQTEAELLFPLGTVVQLKLAGAQKMVVGGAEVSITGTSYTCFWDNNVSTFPEAVLQRAESAVESQALRLTEELLTAAQAKRLEAWRADYFDYAGALTTEALLNVLKLRLWGHEIKEPALKSLAERDSNICADTADLLEALVSSGE